MRVGKLFHMGVPGGVGTMTHQDPPSWDVSISPPGDEHKSAGPGGDPNPDLRHGLKMQWVQTASAEGQADSAAADTAIDLLREDSGRALLPRARVRAPAHTVRGTGTLLRHVSARRHRTGLEPGRRSRRHTGARQEPAALSLASDGHERREPTHLPEGVLRFRIVSWTSRSDGSLGELEQSVSPTARSSSSSATTDGTSASTRTGRR